MCCFLILIDVTYFHANDLVIKRLPLNIMIQSQSSFKLKTQQGRYYKEKEKKTSFKHLQIQNLRDNYNLMEFKHCMTILYR